MQTPSFVILKDMSNFHTSFLTPTSLFQMLEESNTQPVIIFKFSSECNTSSDLSGELKKVMGTVLTFPVYKVVVQDQPALSKKIAEYFDITHESPQIIIVCKGNVTYTAHHRDISIKNFKYTY